MRYKRPDKKDALSLIEAAKKEIEFTFSLEINEASSFNIIRNVYESFRMLGDAILILKGIKSEDHLAPINEIVKLDVKTSRPLNILDNLRILRHNINYYGYEANVDEAKDIKDFAEKCFYAVYKHISTIIKNQQ